MEQALTTLDGVLARLETRFAALEQKIDRIVAMVEERAAVAAQSVTAQSATQESGARRKTLAASAGALLTKLAGESPLALTSADEMLRALSVEQRIAVKAELARAGLLQ